MLRLLSFMSFLLLMSATTESFADFAPDQNNSDGYLLSGEITNLDAQAVRTMIQDRQARKMRSPLVTLNSHGGSIYAAMDIGRNLRKIRATAILGQIRECSSACVFVLAGATQRMVYGSVGIHRPYNPSTERVSMEEAQREYTQLMRLSKSYLTEMNLPQELYEAMVRTPPEELRLLDQKELTNFGLNKTDPVAQDFYDSASAKHFSITKQELWRRQAPKSRD